MPNSSINLQSHKHLTIAMNATLYSASQDEVATIDCFLLSYEMHELPRKKQFPEVDCYVL